jgi:prophage antirepressor-like protein
MPNPSVFQFQDHYQLRVVSIDGEPWFCAKDVCDILGYSNDRDAISRHCAAKGVVKTRHPYIWWSTGFDLY